MAVVITGNNTPTAGGVTYGDGTTYANTAAGSAGGVLYSAGSSAPAFTAAGTSGQVLTSAGSGAPTWATVSSGPTLGTVVTTTSGTVAEFTGIPATVKTIFINFQGVSFAVSTQNIQMQLGDATAYVTSGYVAGVARVGSGATGISNITGSATLAVSDTVTTAETFSGTVILALLNSSTNRWSWQGNLYCSQSQVNVSAGNIALTGVITRLKIFGNSSTVDFDAGSINISYL